MAPTERRCSPTPASRCMLHHSHYALLRTAPRVCIYQSTDPEESLQNVMSKPPPPSPSIRKRSPASTSTAMALSARLRRQQSVAPYPRQYPPPFSTFHHSSSNPLWSHCPAPPSSDVTPPPTPLTDTQRVDHGRGSPLRADLLPEPQHEEDAVACPRTSRHRQPPARLGPAPPTGPRCCRPPVPQLSRRCRPRRRRRLQSRLRASPRPRCCSDEQVLHQLRGAYQGEFEREEEGETFLAVRVWKKVPSPQLAALCASTRPLPRSCPPHARKM